MSRASTRSLERGERPGVAESGEFAACLVAEGDPHGIWQDERVQNAYLGVTVEEA